MNDVFAIQHIYRASTTASTGDTVYGFFGNVTGTLASLYDITVNLNPMLTLIDFAGNNALSLSGCSSPSFFNLLPEGYSSCNNIAFAYTWVVENAATGAGNDTPRGNSAANQLDGGASSGTAVFAGAFCCFSFRMIPQTFTTPFQGQEPVIAFFWCGAGRAQQHAARLLSTDRVAPIVLGFSPADNVKKVAATARLVLTISKAVMAGGGSITVHHNNSMMARIVLVRDALQISIAGRHHHH